MPITHLTFHLECHVGYRDDAGTSLELVVVVVVVATGVGSFVTTILVVVISQSNSTHHFRKSDVMWQLRQLCVVKEYRRGDNEECLTWLLFFVWYGFECIRFFLNVFF